MSKRSKSTATQKNMAVYNRYQLALSYYGIKLKTLVRPTIKSVNRAKKIWKQHKENLKKHGFIDLPTVYEASAYMKQQNALQSVENVSRETSYDIVIDNETIADQEDTNISNELDTLIDVVMDMKGRRLDINVSKEDVRKNNEVRTKLERQLDYGRQKLGDYNFLKALKESDIYTRFEDILAFADYYYLETAGIEEQALPFLQSIIERAVAEL